MHLTPDGELLLDYTITIFDTIKKLTTLPKPKGIFPEKYPLPAHTP
jgi:hypothetical protein